MLASKLNKKVLAIIPARYKSTRFPGKPLALIAGKPMIQHVWERANSTKGIDEVIVATDDERISNTVTNFGGKVSITSSYHKTGTDRIVEVISQHSSEWILNIQGDEPLIVPQDLEKLISKTLNKKGVKCATLIHEINDEKVFNDPNIVKVVINKYDNALYFSRASIPFVNFYKKGNISIFSHLGIYMFRREFLLNYNSWPQSPLEKIENLEQLRIIENGEKILCVKSENKSLSVDIPEDISIIEESIKNKSM